MKEIITSKIIAIFALFAIFSLLAEYKGYDHAILLILITIFVYQK